MASSDEGLLGGEATLVEDDALGPTAAGARPGPVGYGALPPLTRGDRVGRYVIHRQLGRGGMGIVYAAFDPELDRQLAIKLLNPEPGGSQRSSDGQQRMLREARAMAQLSHPNVVTVLDVGTHGRSVFVAMELVEGQTLRDWNRSSRSWPEVVEVFVRAGEGLAAAHAAGLVHRDFKPDNVMIGTDGRVLVMDFGLARASELSEEKEIPTAVPVADDAAGGSLVSDRLTRTGALVGTPAYMAPEQHHGMATNAHVDQFAFCVTLYEALYGQRPFKGHAPAALAYEVTRGRVVDRPRDSEIPAWLHRLVLRGLDVEPVRRWPSMVELLAEVRRAPARARRRWILGAMGGGLVAAGLGSLWVARSGDDQLCSGAEEQFAEVWNDERRGRLAEAFTSTGISYAEDTWRRVEQRVDRMQTAWVVQYVEACEATNAQEVQSQDLLDRRMACLSGRLRDVDGLLEAFADPDAKLVRRAARVVADTASVGACADTNALMATYPLPEDAQTRERVEELRSRLSQARTRQNAGEYRDAVELLRVLAVDAEELAFDPVIADVLLLLGQAQQSIRAYEEAEETLSKAFFAARAGGHDHAAVYVATVLISLMGSNLGRYEEAARWERSAQSELRRVGEGGVAHARFADAVGMLRFDQRKLEEATSAHREALAIWEKLEEEGGLDTGICLYNLANAEFLLADLETAHQHYLQARDAFEKHLGPNHPKMLDAFASLGNSANRSGQFEEARRYYARALEVGEAAFGPDHPGLAMPINGLALLHGKLGESEAALALFRRGYELVKAARGPEDLDAAQLSDGAADTLRELGRYAEALELHEEIRRVRAKALGADHPMVSDSLLDTGRDLIGLGRGNEAAVKIRAALAIRERRADPEEMMNAHFALARALWQSGENEAAALASARRALEHAYKDAEDLAEDIDEIEAWLAERS